MSVRVIGAISPSEPEFFRSWSLSPQLPPPDESEGIILMSGARLEKEVVFDSTLPVGCAAGQGSERNSTGTYSCCLESSLSSSASGSGDVGSDATGTQSKAARISVSSFLPSAAGAERLGSIFFASTSLTVSPSAAADATVTAAIATGKSGAVRTGAL